MDTIKRSNGVMGVPEETEIEAWFRNTYHEIIKEKFHNLDKMWDTEYRTVLKD